MAWVRLGRLAHSFGDRAEAEHGLSVAQSQMNRLRDKERLHVRLLAADMAMNDVERQAIVAELLKKFPGDTEMLFIAGNRAFHRGDFVEALSCFEKIAIADPTAGQAYNMMGYTLAELERYPEATQALQKYTFLTPGQPNPHDSLGELYMRTGRLDAAIAEFEANALSTLGRNEEALQELNEARVHAPGLPDSEYWDRCQIFLEREAGRPEKALDLARAFDAKDPGGPFAPFAMGFIHAKNGHAELAREDLKALSLVIEKARQEALKPAFMEKAEPMYFELAGHVAIAEKDWNGAIDAFTKCLDKVDLWTMQRSIRVELMHCMIESGRAADALETGTALLAVNSTDPVVNFWCGRALEQLGRHDEAAAHFRKTLEVMAGADAGNELVRMARERAQKS